MEPEKNIERLQKVRALPRNQRGGGKGPNLGTAVLWQTPVADDAIDRERGKVNSRGEAKLSAQVKMWPTPRAEDSQCAGGHRGKDDTLYGAICRPKNYPTPKSRDWKGASQRGIHAQGDALPNQDRGDGKPISGSLNPAWVSWLQGWPFDAATGWDWTSLDPAPQGAMDSIVDPWREEPAIPRVAVGVTNRVARLKALGNGQVPQAAALAWKILMESHHV